MTQKDYYTVLGVAEDASASEIKKRHRELAKRYHPDRNSGDEAAEGRFKEVQEAYDVLGDAEKRKKYDDLRRFGAHGGAGVDFDSIFGQGGAGFGGSVFDLFERAGFGHQRGRPRPMRGDDLAFEIQVPFEEAAFGGERTISVPRSEDCTECGGTGSAKGKSESCPTCRGTGSATSQQGGFAFSRPCPQCLGRGQVVKDPCPTCAGSGTRRRTRRLSVKIPAGVGNGSKIRLKGEGEPGPAGAPSGDLILTVRVAAHSDFRRRGRNVESDLAIDIAEAALGTTKDVATLGGTVELKVPAGIQPGSRLRIAGRGIRDHRGRTGDHFVKITVEVPKELTDRQRRILEEYREAE